MERREIILLFLFVTDLGCGSDILPSIVWTASNPLFSNLGGEPRKVNEYDKIYIVCPISEMNLVTQSIARRNIDLVENMFLVDAHGYKTCNATGGKKILDCKKPTSNELESTILVFQPYHGNDGLEFHSGKEYYFIGTASRSASNIESSINNLVGGNCKDGLRMKFYVCKDKDESKCRHRNKVMNGGWTNWSICDRGVQTRSCTAPAPENGGVMCTGEIRRSCSVHTTDRPTTEVSDTPTTTAATTTHLTSGTPSPSDPMPEIQKPGSKDKNDTFTVSNNIVPGKSRARASVDAGVSQHLGVLLAVGAVILLLGVALGIMVGIFCYRSRRQQDRMKDNRGSIDVYSDSERPLSILSAGSEVSQKPLVKLPSHTFLM